MNSPKVLSLSLPYGATITFPMYNLIFTTDSLKNRSLRIPCSFVYGFAIIGGYIILRRILVFGLNTLKKLIYREKTELTRRDGPEDFEDKTALITGADGLMGRGFAKELAGRNFNLIIVGHDREKLEELTTEIQTQIGVVVTPIVTDFKDTVNMDAYRDRLIDYTQFKSIQVCINAEHVLPKGNEPTFDTTDMSFIREQIVRHALIPLITTQVAMANMKENNRYNKSDLGVILNVTTAMVSQPNQYLPVHAGSRAFTDYISQALAKSYVNEGIYIASVRQWCWPWTDEAAFVQFAASTLREVFQSRQIHGGRVNTIKSGIYDLLWHKIKSQSFTL